MSAHVEAIALRINANNNNGITLLVCHDEYFTLHVRQYQFLNMQVTDGHREHFIRLVLMKTFLSHVNCTAYATLDTYTYRETDT